MFYPCQREASQITISQLRCSLPSSQIRWELLIEFTDLPEIDIQIRMGQASEKQKEGKFQKRLNYSDSTKFLQANKLFSERMLRFKDSNNTQTNNKLCASTYTIRLSFQPWIATLLVHHKTLPAGDAFYLALFVLKGCQEIKFNFMTVNYLLSPEMIFIDENHNPKVWFSRNPQQNQPLNSFQPTISSQLKLVKSALDAVASSVDQELGKEFYEWLSELRDDNLSQTILKIEGILNRRELSLKSAHRLRSLKMLASQQRQSTFFQEKRLPILERT